MICPRCGNEIPNAQDTCPSCGYTLHGDIKQGSQARSTRSTQRTAGLSKPSFGNRPAPKNTVVQRVQPASAEPELAQKQDDPQPNQPSCVPEEVGTPVTGEPQISVLPADATPVELLDNYSGALSKGEGKTDIRADMPDQGSQSRKETKRKKDKKTKKEKKAKKRRLSTGMRIFIWSLIAAVLIGGGVCAHLYVRSNYNTWPRMFKVVFGIGQTQVYPVTVEAVTGSDGLPAHRFTIRGDNPDVVVVHTLNDQHLTFIDGIATVTIPDSYFIPETVTEDVQSMTIDVSFSILDNRGNLTPTPCDPVTIDIPQTVVTNLMPAETAVSTYEDAIAISMNVLEKSTVTINGEDATSSVTDGVFSKSIPVVMGENTIEIVVTTPFYRAFSHTLSITRTLPPVSVKVDKEPASRTEDRTVKITGTYEKGASLKLTGKGSLSYSKSQGTFTITLTMSSLGPYEGTLTATLSGKSDGVYRYFVERIPDATDYQKAATTPDLAKLFADFSDYKGDKLKLSGTVSAVGDNTLTISLGEGQELTFSYFGDTVTSVGDMVTVYGEIQSVSNNVPTCYAWFVVI